MTFNRELRSDRVLEREARLLARLAQEAEDADRREVREAEKEACLLAK